MKNNLCLVASAAGVGGGEKNLLDIAAHFSAQESFKVFVICPSHGTLEDKLKKLNIEVTVVPMPSIPRFMSFLRISELIQKWGIDIVHAHGTRAALYARVASRIKAKKPCIYTIHGLHYVHYENRILKWLYILGERLLVGWTTKFVCVCHSDVEKASKYGVINKDKAIVIYNGIQDLKLLSKDDISVIKRNFNIDGDKQFVLHVSRFHTQKGQLYLIDAISKAKKNGGNAKYVLVGNGDAFDAVIEEAGSLGLTENDILFTGLREDISQLMQACDVFILSSLWEGLPYAILEAMAASKPVISTDVDGIPEAVINNKTGLLVSPCDTDALARSLTYLLTNASKARSLGIEAHKRYLEMFTIADMLESFERLYGEVLRNE